eukprot:gene5793-9614_t
MKLIVKTLANQSFETEVDSNATIAEVKKKIEEAHQYDSANMKLIFNGKVLDNKLTLNSEGINEQNFLVIVGKKVGATSRKKKKVEETKKEEPKKVEESKKTEEVKKPEEPKKTEEKQENSTITSTTTTNQSNPDFAVGEEYAQIVQQFLEMGFEKPYIEQCMKAAFNNPQRAAEYLMSGIPDNFFEQEMTEQTTEQTSQPTTQQTSQQTTQQTNSSNSSLESLLKQHPQFNQIKTAIQGNPDLLQPALGKIAQENPNLMQAIQANPQEFLRLINEPVSQQDLMNEQSFDDDQMEGQEMNQQNAPPGTIFITQQEKQEIDSIVGMGFDRMVVVQTYFACNKDTNATVNILLEMMSNDYMYEENPSNNDSSGSGPSDDKKE